MASAAVDGSGDDEAGQPTHLAPKASAHGHRSGVTPPVLRLGTVVDTIRCRPIDIGAAGHTTDGGSPGVSPWGAAPAR